MKTLAFKEVISLVSDPSDDPVISSKNPPPKVVSISEILSCPPKQEDTLLGDRWLCRRGAAVLIGPSGIGKSSASMQQDLCWAVGREAFGIQPANPLKIVTIQAENDGGDLHEMASGVLNGLNLSDSELELLKANFHLVFEQSRTGERFVTEVLAPILDQQRPDLIRIDPLSAYAGADITQADKSAALLREQINPLLTEYNCGLILVHHTPKTTGRDTTKWKPNDWSYAGAGSADITNWARAMIVIDPGHNMGVYRFVAAKRGGRIGWRDEMDEKIYEKWFQHSPAKYFCWEETEAPLITGKPPKLTVEDVWPFIPLAPERVRKTALVQSLNIEIGIGVERAKGYLDKLVENGSLIVTKEARSGTNPATYLQRASHINKPYRDAKRGVTVSVLSPAGREGFRT